ncbi:MAG: metalloregulator ArsR/SmtB family transcription factor [Pseudomonadota bacterium]
MTEHQNVSRALAALGHEARLDIFRLLVKAGHDGMTVGQISGHLGLAASTLAHHLRMLVDAGLVAQQKNGREVVNTVNFDEMDHIIAFLTDNCCAGVPANTVTAPDVARQKG